MSEMEDRVAKALEGQFATTLERMNGAEFCRMKYRAAARAAIRAMREPTTKMVEAGFNAERAGNNARGVWKMMIHAALSRSVATGD